jgi:signal transduction histidine kinase/ActR/RegA family two-component response regulator
MASPGSPPYSEAHFRRLLEKLPAGAYTCDAEGLITYFNQHAVLIWGRAPGLNDPEDRYCGSFRLYATDGSPIAHDQCWMALALQHQTAFNRREIVIERPDGSRLTVLAHANPILDDAGELIGAVNVLVDITDRKRAEEALRQADQTKNEFLATLAHELRNPLTPIHNAVRLLRAKGAGVPDVQWPLEVIERQVAQLTRLVDDLLDIARITSNKLELRPEQVNAADVIRSAVETCGPLIEAREHHLTVVTPAEPVRLHADPTRLAQAIANLLHNAAKYTDRGGRIRVETIGLGTEAIITVRDNGIGIRPALLPQIFQMFTQADRPADRVQGGLGVGLTLTRRLIEMHDGTIEAHSDGPGTGSLFTVRLPTASELPDQPPAPLTAEPVELPVPAAPLRILVVDDNPDLAETMGLILQELGEIRIAHDGREALAIADPFRPDVVLLDIGLPVLDGYETARRIRAQPWGAAIRLIAVTGWGQEADRERARAAGFDHHFVKPVDPLLLMRVIAGLKGDAQRPAL